VTIVTILKTYAVPMSGHDEEKRYAVVAEMRRRWTLSGISTLETNRVT
jgi:hypothetical protein